MRPRWIPFLLAGVLLASCGCAVRDLPDLVVAPQVAEQICAVQSMCDCDQELLIPDCESTVEDDIGRREAQAIEAGFEFHQDCLDKILAQLPQLAECGSVGGGVPPAEFCPAYSGTAEVGAACFFYEFFPPMTNCRRGLECDSGICREPSAYVPKEPIAIGETCQDDIPCEFGSHCRLDENDSDESGVCTENTPAGARCELVQECDYICEDGTCVPLPTGLCDFLETWSESREWPQSL